MAAPLFPKQMDPCIWFGTDFHHSWHKSPIYPRLGMALGVHYNLNYNLCVLKEADNMVVSATLFSQCAQQPHKLLLSQGEGGFKMRVINVTKVLWILDGRQDRMKYFQHACGQWSRYVMCVISLSRFQVIVNYGGHRQNPLNLTYSRNYSSISFLLTARDFM